MVYCVFSFRQARVTGCGIIVFLVLFCSRCQAQQYHLYNMCIVYVNLLLQSLLHRRCCLELIIIFMIIIFITVNQYHLSNILCMLTFYFHLSFIDIIVMNFIIIFMIIQLQHVLWEHYCGSFSRDGAEVGWHLSFMLTLFSSCCLFRCCLTGQA